MKEINEKEIPTFIQMKEEISKKKNIIQARGLFIYNLKKKKKK